MNGVYIAGTEPGDLTLVCPLPASSTATLATRRAGTREYLTGTITVTAPDIVATLLDIDRRSANAWALWDGSHMRIKSVGLGDGGILEIHVDQSLSSIARQPETGARIAVRLVEPSPPRPVAEWKKAETDRALADYLAAQKAGRTI